MRNYKFICLALAIIAAMGYSCKEDDPDEKGGSGDLAFGDIGKSSYSATGVPGFLDKPGPSSWTGQVTPSTGTDLFYEISGWGGVKEIVAYCDFRDKQIFIDHYTKVADNGATHDGYFRALAINAGAKTYTEITDDYPVAYDKTKKVLDFSGTYKGLPVYVGVVSIESSTDEIVGAFTELYANARLTLTSTSSSSKAPAKAAVFTYSKSISGESLKNYRKVALSK